MGGVPLPLKVGPILPLYEVKRHKYHEVNCGKVLNCDMCALHHAHDGILSGTLGTGTCEQDPLAMSFIAEVEPLGKFITGSKPKLVVHFVS